MPVIKRLAMNWQADSRVFVNKKTGASIEVPVTFYLAAALAAMTSEISVMVIKA